MLPSVDYMRAEVARLYSGDGWKRRVAQMSDAQVIAIYCKRLAG